MIKVFLMSSAFIGAGMCARLPLGNIEGAELPGVELEMTREALLVLYPGAFPMVSNSDNILGVRLPEGGVAIFTFRDNTLACVTISHPNGSPAQQVSQTQLWIDHYREKFGNPLKIGFGKLRLGVPYPAAGLVFDLNSQFPNVKVIVESNEVSMQITVFRTDLFDKVASYVSFASLAEDMPTRPKPTAAPFRDFVAELVP